MNKVVRIGTGPYGSVFAKIGIAGGTLSISGVEGPTRGGNARGGCGQIDMHPWNIKTYAPGWNAKLEAKFREVWSRWHLNNMRAGCEHQRGIDTTRKVEVVSYGLTTEAYRIREKAIERAAKAQASGTSADLTDTERALILLDEWFKYEHNPPDADSPLSGCYEVKKREQKAIGWTCSTEHPDGLLTKPCEVCGYKYGSAWHKEELPQEVIDFLASLPDTDITPEWV